MITTSPPRSITSLFKDRLLTLAKGEVRVSSCDNIVTSPFECQVVQTVPRFFVTDGVHAVQCKFAKEAILALVKESPGLDLAAISSRWVVLLRFEPKFVYLPETGVEFFFLVHKLSLAQSQRASQIPAALGRSYPQLHIDPDFRPFAEIAEQSCISEVVQKSGIANELPQISDLSTETEGPRTKLHLSDLPCVRSPPAEADIVSTFSEISALILAAAPANNIQSPPQQPMEQVAAGTEAKIMGLFVPSTGESRTVPILTRESFVSPLVVAAEKSADEAGETFPAQKKMGLVRMIKLGHATIATSMSNAELLKYTQWKSVQIDDKITQKDIDEQMKNCGVGCIRLKEAEERDEGKRTAEVALAGSPDADGKRKKLAE